MSTERLFVVTLSITLSSNNTDGLHAVMNSFPNASTQQEPWMFQIPNLIFESKDPQSLAG